MGGIEKTQTLITRLNIKRPSEIQTAFSITKTLVFAYSFVYLFVASVMLCATLVALTVKPDIPINEAAANLINSFMLVSFPSVILPYVERRQGIFFSCRVWFVGFAYGEADTFSNECLKYHYFLAASAKLRATMAAEAVTPAIPIRDAAAKVIKCFM